MMRHRWFWVMLLASLAVSGLAQGSESAREPESVALYRHIATLSANGMREEVNGGSK